jgi:hypothetical protein
MHGNRVDTVRSVFVRCMASSVGLLCMEMHGNRVDTARSVFVRCRALHPSLTRIGRRVDSGSCPPRDLLAKHYSQQHVLGYASIDVEGTKVAILQACVHHMYMACASHVWHACRDGTGREWYRQRMIQARGHLLTRICTRICAYPCPGWRTPYTYTWHVCMACDTHMHARITLRFMKLVPLGYSCLQCTQI